MPSKRIISGLTKRKFGNYPDTPEVSELSFLRDGIDIRLEYAKILVSLWSHACMADGAFHEKEGNLVGEMVKALFEPGSILSDYKDSKTEVVDVLSEVFDSPLPMKTITKVVEGNDQYALNFYEDAVCIVSTDGKLKKDEREFLDELAVEFQLSQIDKHQVEKRYDIH
ncbi:MAG: TerB family tellurite resistance protein [Leptospiraceae bacterium]|nr:TerB family tellurite resistance protein [Leptospiraceae bacterium]